MSPRAKCVRQFQYKMRSVKNNGPLHLARSRFNSSFSTFEKFNTVKWVSIHLRLLSCTVSLSFLENQNYIHCLIIYIYTHEIHVSCQRFELSHLHCMPFPKTAATCKITKHGERKRAANRTSLVHNSVKMCTIYRSFKIAWTFWNVCNHFFNELFQMKC